MGSLSPSDSSNSSRAEDKTFGEITKERLVKEMIGSTKVSECAATCKVLIVDKFTQKIMSNSCKVSDIEIEAILVEGLYERRQPMPITDAIYFMQPLEENVTLFLSDMSGRHPLYKKAYLFFSSPAPTALVARIEQSSVRTRLSALNEINLEYFAIDNQAFITGQERALEKIFAENTEDSYKCNAYIHTMATRIATVFASLKEFPRVWYRAAKSCLDTSSMSSFHDIFPTKLAAEIWNCLSEYECLTAFPQEETCELLIVDRSVDLIAPVIHEWTYDAMCHDLLNMDGDIYVHEVPSETGLTEKEEVLLGDHDPLWLELRHAHIADASERLHEKMANFMSRNKAAKYCHTLRNGGEVSIRDMKKALEALPKFKALKDKLSLHIEIAEKIMNVISELGLRDIGQLEQDLAFGRSGTEELIEFLKENQEMDRESKLRLLMIYAAIYPEKCGGVKGIELMQLARLSPNDVVAVNNMRYLQGSDVKMTSRGGFSLKFNFVEKHAARRVRNEEAQFCPMIEELIVKLSKGELSKKDYPCVNAKSSLEKSRRTHTWAKPRNCCSGYSSDSISSGSRRKGRRIFIFIIGGATRSELRAVHKLSSELRREVILGSTSLDDPPHFITKVKMLRAEALL